MSTVLNPSDAKCFTGMIQNMCNNVIYEHKLQYIRTYNTYKFVPRDHNLKCQLLAIVECIFEVLIHKNVTNVSRFREADNLLMT